MNPTNWAHTPWEIPRPSWVNGISHLSAVVREIKLTTLDGASTRSRHVCGGWEGVFARRSTDDAG